MSRSAPRSRKIIESQLATFREIISSAESAGTEDFASQLAMESMLAHEQSLVDELCAAEMFESTNDLEISIDGAPVKDHMITATFLGEFLRDVQKIISRVIFAAGSLSAVGDKIPEDSLLESRMMVAGWRASSFTVLLRMASSEHSGDFFSSDRREIAFKDLHELFNNTSSDEDVTSLITRSASKNSYEKLLRNVANNGAVVKVRTKVNPFGTELSSDVAGDRIKRMEVSEKETKETLKVTGILVGGNIDTCKFVIKTTSASYHGPIASDAQKQIKKITLGARINATIAMVTKYRTKEDLKPTVTYTLESILEAAPETQAENLSLFE